MPTTSTEPLLGKAGTMVTATELPLLFNPLLFLGLLASIFAWLLIRVITIQQKPRPRQKEVKSEELFVTPLPQPQSVEPNSMPPKLYRPFHHGPNPITMGIRKLNWNNWIEMDSYFLRYHETKALELKKYFKEHVKYVDNAVTRDACFELNEELVRFLVHHDSYLFRASDDLGPGTLHPQFGAGMRQCLSTRASLTGTRPCYRIWMSKTGCSGKGGSYICIRRVTFLIN